MRRNHGIGGAAGLFSNITSKQRRNALALAVAATAAASAMPALAATKTWTATTSGNWSTAASWGGSVPAVTGDTINVTNGTTASYTVTFDNSATSTSIAALTVGAGSTSFSGAIVFAFPSGSTKVLANTGLTTIGGISTNASAKGTIQQDGATYNATGGMNVGGAANGVYLLNAGSLTVGTENIANAGFGTFTQTGGTHTATTLNLAPDALANAVYTMSNGTLNAANETVANLGLATFTQTGGTHTNSGTLNVALGSGSFGFYNLTNGALTSANQVWGNLGQAQMTQNNGTNTVSGAGGSDGLVIGAGAGGPQSQYTLNGGTINVTATTGMTIGRSGTGLFNQNAGTVTIGAGKNLNVGSLAGSSGTYILSNAALSVGGNAYIGGSSAGAGGTGSMNITGITSAVTVTGTLKIWNSNFSSLTFNGGTLSVGSLDTSGNSGGFVWNAGTLNITGGGGATIGGSGALAGNPQINGGQALNVTGLTTIPSGAVVSINGGSFTGSTLSAAANSIAFGSGSFTLTGEGLNIDFSGPMGSSVAVSPSSTITVSGALVNGGTLAMSGGSVGGASLLTNNGVITGSGTITGAGGLTNTNLIALGGGNLAVNKTGIFQNSAGATIQLDSGRQLQVNGGNLQNSGTIDLDGSGQITSSSGASLINASDGTLMGSGSIAIPVSNAGTIIVPSNNLNISGALTNTGTIRLDNVTSRITVGSTGLANSAGGIVSGYGRVNGALSNSGYIEAVGGLLQLGGATTNSTGGTLAISAGNEIQILGAPGANAGTISLTGGTFTTNNQAITNAAAGVIAGNGTIRTGGLTNAGQVQLSGGPTYVYGTVSTSSGGKIIVSGSSLATFYNNVGMSSGSEFRVTAGSTAVFFAPVTGQANFTGTGTKSFEAGGSALVGALATGGSTVVQSGASVSLDGIQENALTVNGNVAVNVGGTTSKVTTLAIATGAKLDLTNNKLIVASGGAGAWNGTNYDGAAGLVKSGRGTGSWNGTTGIVTSMTAATVSQLTSLAVASASDVGKTTFGGQSVTGSDALVMYTYTGDANLSGKIDADDYFQIDSNYNKSANSAKKWSNGDFNYDGKITGDDYFLIDAAYAGQGAPFSSGPELALGGLSAVPEPATGAILGLGAMMSLRRRKRRAM